MSYPCGVVSFLQKIETDARSRPAFELAREFARRPVRLSSGPAPETLICIPALLALCGPHQFARFSQGFRGVREILVPHIPGFLAEERVPASLDVAIAHQIRAVEAAIGRNSPLILAGYSTGGVFAYGLASRLEARGWEVAAVVLLDTYPPRQSVASSRQVAAVVEHLLSSREWRHYLTETRLTAMGWYIYVLRMSELRPVMAPTLLVRAKDPMTTVDGDDWQASWPFPHETRDVPGDHYSMMQLHAGTAAQTVENWLRLRLGGSAENLWLDQQSAA